MEMQSWQLHCRILCKWLLTKHLKEVHGLVAKKSKLGRPSTATGGLRHQNHAKMNACILGNAMAVQRRNDQKVASRAHAKAECEWNHLVTLAKQCPPLPKPPLVKLALEQLLKVLGINAWAWAVCFEMQHPGWRRMKIYKG